MVEEFIQTQFRDKDYFLVIKIISLGKKLPREWVDFLSHEFSNLSKDAFSKYI